MTLFLTAVQVPAVPTPDHAATAHQNNPRVLPHLEAYVPSLCCCIYFHIYRSLLCACYSLQHNPQSIFGALSSNAAVLDSAPSILVLLKLDSGKKPASTISEPAVTSQSTAAGAAKRTSPTSNATSASKSAEISEAFKFRGTETEMPRLLFGLLYGELASDFSASSAPKPLPGFGGHQPLPQLHRGVEDGSKAGTSTPTTFGGSDFGAHFANGVSNNI
ncbi:hypothetical protein EDD22DRAFT_843569 [Suillus occidentalis]|nr:hypothetical protein EDD22DRAFT_843569 [Suillus occidentalis]